MRPQRDKLRRRKVVEVPEGACRVRRPARIPDRIPPREVSGKQYSWKMKQQAEDRRTTLNNKMTQLRGLLELDEIIGGDGAVLEGVEKEKWLQVRKTRLQEAELEMEAVREFLHEPRTDPLQDPCPQPKPKPPKLAVSSPAIPSHRVLLGRCYRLIVSLDERDVDLGEEGQALLSEMERVVSPDVLLGEEGKNS